MCFSPFRQQYAQALAQQKAAVLSSAPLQQQQQHQQQINLLLQQYQALKIRFTTLVSLENTLPVLIPGPPNALLLLTWGLHVFTERLRASYLPLPGPYLYQTPVLCGKCRTHHLRLPAPPTFNKLLQVVSSYLWCLVYL